MDNNQEVKEILKTRICGYINKDEKSKKGNTGIMDVGGYPVFRFPYFKILSKVLNMMEHGRAIRPMVQAGKECLSLYGFEDQTDSYYNALLCLGPAKYVNLLVQEGADVNALHAHPVYLLDSQPQYPALVFAAYDADCEKVRALIHAGADKNYGIVAAEKCLSADHTHYSQKLSCLQELKLSGVNLFEDKAYSKLTGLLGNSELRDWFEEEKSIYDAQSKVVSHQTRASHILAESKQNTK